MASKADLAILNADDFRKAVAKRSKTADVDVPGVGRVRLRAPSAWVRSQIAAKFREMGCSEEDVKNRPEVVMELAGEILAQMWTDGDGNLLMPHDEGVEFFRLLSEDEVEPLVVKAMDLMGLTDKSLEQAEKNSEASRIDSTPSGSPKNSDTPTST